MPLFVYFLITVLIEMPLVIYYYRKEWKRALVVGLLLNLFTWPLLHIFLFETRININYLEIIIVLVEGFGYYLLMKSRLLNSLLLSILANGLSYAAGILINQ